MDLERFRLRRFLESLPPQELQTVERPVALADVAAGLPDAGTLSVRTEAAAQRLARLATTSPAVRDTVATRPSPAKSEILLDVPRYVFDWQATYRFAEPKKIPAGTRLRVTAVFDNSAENPANPDPTQAVRWGDQTWDEMLIGYVDYVEE